MSNKIKLYADKHEISHHWTGLQDTGNDRINKFNEKHWNRATEHSFIDSMWIYKLNRQRNLTVMFSGTHSAQKETIERNGVNIQSTTACA